MDATMKLMRGITRVYYEDRSMRFPSGLNGPCSDERVYLKKSLDHTHE
jgi:hypothetical protein